MHRPTPFTTRAIVMLALLGVVAAPTPGAAQTAPADAVPPADPGATHEKKKEARPDAHWGPVEVLGRTVEPGEQEQMFLLATESFAGSSMRTPVVVVRGVKPGLTFCMTAGIHGDELNGVEVVREVVEEIEADQLRGTVIAIPIVNLHGFQRNSRYLPDRRDLNRYFPGDPSGSSASRIAHALFDGLIMRCHALVDLHSGSLHRSNLPQLRGDLRIPTVLDLARGFGAAVVLHHEGRSGTIRRAATDAGIPAIIYEAGEPMRFQRNEIERGVAGVRNLMAHLGMHDVDRESFGEQRIYYDSHWVRVDRGGILVSTVGLGDEIDEGEILGTVADPLRRGRNVITSPYTGRLIGMNLAPVVIPGDAAFHIGVPGTLASTTAPRKPVVDDSESEEERPE